MDATGHPDAASWHEAGHAVVAHLLGGQVRSVTLESDREGHDGHSEVLWKRGDATEIATRSAQVALAGPLAELSFTGVDVLDDVAVIATWTADWAEVERAAAIVDTTDEGRRRSVEGWIREVAALLADPRCDELVARVADALHAHGTVDAALFADCVD